MHANVFHPAAYRPIKTSMLQHIAIRMLCCSNAHVADRMVRLCESDSRRRRARVMMTWYCAHAIATIQAASLLTVCFIGATVLAPAQAGEGIVGGSPLPPLVGNIAPDFSAQAVYDQEFIDITLSQYRG